MKFDELPHVVCGDDFQVSNGIIIRNPLVREIKDYGQFNYLGLIQYITMRAYDNAVELWDNGINYQEIPDFAMFVNNMKTLPPEITGIMFGDLDFTKFEIGVNEQNGEIVFSNGEFVIDEVIYREMMEFVRGIHYLDEKVEYDMANMTGVKFLIERMRRKQKRNAKKKPQPFLSNLISSMVCRADFPYDYRTIMDLHISQLYNGFYRTNKSDTAKYLTQAIYAGTVSKKDIATSLLTWYGDLEKSRS